MSPLRQAIIPAAGLGTRLRPLTLETPKEMLPLGPHPTIKAALLEADAAGLDKVAIVLGPHKAPLATWLDAGRRAQVAIAIATQPSPLGVLDAVARGLALLDPTAPYAVLYPDFVHLPDQRALAQLAPLRPPDSTLFGLYRTSEQTLGRMGRSVRAITRPVSGRLHQIVRVESPDTPAPGHFHTTFAEIRGAAHARIMRDILGKNPSDGALLAILMRLADDGLLFGAEIEGAVLDTGVMPGYRDAVGRFEAGKAAWRTS